MLPLLTLQIHTYIHDERSLPASCSVLWPRNRSFYRSHRIMYPLKLVDLTLKVNGDCGFTRPSLSRPRINFLRCKGTQPRPAADLFPLSFRWYFLAPVSKGESVTQINKAKLLMKFDTIFCASISYSWLLPREYSLATRKFGNERLMQNRGRCRDILLYDGDYELMTHWPNFMLQ